MIKDLIVIAVSFYPIAIAYVLAIIVSEIYFKLNEKKQKKRRRAVHKLQANADMQNMNTLYNQLILNQITKGI